MAVTRPKHRGRLGWFELSCATAHFAVRKELHISVHAYQLESQTIFIEGYARCVAYRAVTLNTTQVFKG
jgi:hypothetical protein